MTSFPSLGGQLTIGRPNVKITASVEGAAECHNGPSAEAETLPQML